MFFATIAALAVLGFLANEGLRRYRWHVREDNARRSGVVSLRMAPGGTIEAWSAKGTLVWESEPGDDGHATLATIMGEAAAIDTRPVQAPQEGPRG